MHTAQKPKGPWLHRFAIHIFTVILAILVYWVLGFLVQDIESIKGPPYADTEKQHINQELLERGRQLGIGIAAADRAIAAKREEMRIVNDSSQNLQKTINQLIELQKLTVQKGGMQPEAEQASLAESMARFLESQRQYQTYNAELSALSENKRVLEAEKLEVEQELGVQRGSAREAFKQLQERHNLRLAALQLLILLPLLAVGAVLLFRKRESIYFPLILGFAAATLLKVSLVIHAYFPSRYFKYVLVLGLLAVVVKLLVTFIRMVARPQVQWLLNQYREAYERFLCPVCEYPIRMGPRRFLYWTRRSVGKVTLPQAPHAEQPYTCPACGTRLFEICAECKQVRHALLPYCPHCHAEKAVIGGAEAAPPAASGLQS
jgi:predicted RNA-binding Zn-ribbon protein involved in translation (DUF1610 family)